MNGTSFPGSGRSKRFPDFKVPACRACERSPCPVRPPQRAGGKGPGDLTLHEVGGERQKRRIHSGFFLLDRSEERRVGKGCRAWRSACGDERKDVWTICGGG